MGGVILECRVRTHFQEEVKGYEFPLRSLSTRAYGTKDP